MGWKEFEQECYQYLYHKYGNKEITFTKLGESNSEQSDIFVSLCEGEEYYIEIKEAKAQCGQFVVFPNDTESIFEYSIENKFPIDTYSARIISYMNGMYETFRNPGTKGKDIELEKEIFIHWIIHHYEQKGVKFFITKGKEGFIIFPIYKFGDYFDVSAKYRIKKSGSKNPGKKDLADIEKILKDAAIWEYSIDIKDKKTHITLEKNIDKMRAEAGNYEYYFRKFAERDYIVTKLSNTRNPNVIFSIKLKQEQVLEDLEIFEQSLKNFKNNIE